MAPSSNLLLRKPCWFGLDGRYRGQLREREWARKRLKDLENRRRHLANTPEEVVRFTKVTRLADNYRVNLCLSLVIIPETSSKSNSDKQYLILIMQLSRVREAKVFSVKVFFEVTCETGLVALTALWEASNFSL